MHRLNLKVELNELIYIGETIRVELASTAPKILSFQAPKELPIYREKLYLEKKGSGDIPYAHVAVIYECSIGQYWYLLSVSEEIYGMLLAATSGSEEHSLMFLAWLDKNNIKPAYVNPRDIKLNRPYTIFRLTDK